ncbi:Oidioi.mRNA.OKI2018_I69.XSR.g16888.t1.cds [Oikopleura dioica]|uniref:Oidioi.mRNA.OKI2018_I69.XSR.g16888.t1.cds n=1 Tax=Oikopleura dioica TaxID=34765 RepID=A0ABN7SLR1_OIKDI|nr:Oidioi.mRNA.OKI2018_I69.XSR.g16888.t1.cds [Oikopleura dioica]
MNENEIYIDQAIENYLTETNISGLIPVIHNDNSMQTQDKVRMAIFILLPGFVLLMSLAYLVFDFSGYFKYLFRFYCPHCCPNSKSSAQEYYEEFVEDPVSRRRIHRHHSADSVYDVNMFNFLETVKYKYSNV